MSDVETVTPTAEATSGAAAPTEPAKSTTEAAASTTAAAAGQTTQTEPAAKPDAKPVVVPEKYDLKPPEGSRLDQSAIERVAAYAKADGLTQEQAQKAIEREHAAVESYVKAETDAFEKRKEAWLTTASKDPEIGGAQFKQNAELAMRAVNRFASPEFVKLLETTGFGNHPELVRAFNRIGKAMGEDSLALGGGADPAGTENPAEILYGKK